jgi:hypothetical protein
MQQRILDTVWINQVENNRLATWLPTADRVGIYSAAALSELE